MFVDLHTNNVIMYLHNLRGGGFGEEERCARFNPSLPPFNYCATDGIVFVARLTGARDTDRFDDLHVHVNH